MQFLLLRIWITTLCRHFIWVQRYKNWFLKHHIKESLYICSKRLLLMGSLSILHYGLYINAVFFIPKHVKYIISRHFWDILEGRVTATSKINILEWSTNWPHYDISTCNKLMYWGTSRSKKWEKYHLLRYCADK